MTTTEEDLRTDVSPGRQQVALGLAGLVTVPGIALRIGGGRLSDPVLALLFGTAIVGAAFLLSWAAEVAQLHISAGLAIAVGWAVVGFIAYSQWKKKGQADRGREIRLERSHSVELSFLLVATMYSLTLLLKRSITLVDAAVLVTIFVLYTIRISRAPAEEPHLVGPARWIGCFAERNRRLAVIGLFVFAAAVILLCAEHAFAVASGSTHGRPIVGYQREELPVLLGDGLRKPYSVLAGN